jgi:hypothetical protein
MTSGPVFDAVADADCPNSETPDDHLRASATNPR